MTVPRPSYPTAFSKDLLQRRFRSAGVDADLAGQFSAVLQEVLSKQAVDERLNYEYIDRFLGKGGGLGGGFHALVDSDYLVSDPDKREFRGIGEAINYLATLVGTNSKGFRIGVVSQEAAYVEDRAVDGGSASYEIVGLGVNAGPSTARQVIWGNALSETAWWDVNNRFIDVKIPVMRNMTVTSTVARSVGQAILPGLTHAFGCAFGGGSATIASNRFVASSECFFHDCIFENIGPAEGDLYQTYCLDCVFVCDATIAGNSLFRNASNVFQGGAIRISGSTTTVNVSSASQIVLDGVVLEGDGFGLGSLAIFDCTFNFTGAGMFHIHVIGAKRSNFTKQYHFNFTNPRYYFLNIQTGAKLTVGQTSPFSSSKGRGNQILGAYESLDVVGPCVIDARVGPEVSGDGHVKLRGKGINARVSYTVYKDDAADPILDCIGLTDSVVSLALEYGFSTSGAPKAYNLDAASARNIIDYAGASQCPTPSVDAGVGNLIRAT